MDGSEEGVFARAWRTAQIGVSITSMRHGWHDGRPPGMHIPEFTGAEEEFADVVIRIMDAASVLDLDVVGAIIAKMKFNESRPYKHGGKVF